MREIVMSYAAALREALREEMRRDPNIVILGEDVGAWGGVFTVTLGLLQEFGPQRVIDTPISEAAIVGAAIGMALAGLRPVAEIMYMDFITIAMDQLITHAAKLRFMSGGKIKLPIVVRTQYGIGRAYGPQHSQFVPSWFLQPGLKVVAPSTPADAKGLLKASLREDNPVLFIEAALLYEVTGPVPEGEHIVPIGVADIKRKGSDVTIVAISRTVHEALKAAEILSEKHGIEAEVVDPRTLYPLDLKTIASSVRKTGRLVVTTDEIKSGSVAADIVSKIVEDPDTFYSLEATPEIISSPDMPVPTPAPLEKLYMINAEKIVNAVLRIVK
jgi:Pyruvate/2-oxoglutarate dehydrogenase complex, dehydrogenase (E1) component, eukaryotic type, beta subunit